jgi:hypothetical protein
MYRFSTRTADPGRPAIQLPEAVVLSIATIRCGRLGGFRPRDQSRRSKRSIATEFPEGLGRAGLSFSRPGSPPGRRHHSQVRKSACATFLIGVEGLQYAVRNSPPADTGSRPASTRTGASMKPASPFFWKRLTCRELGTGKFVRQPRIKRRRKYQCLTQ